MATANSVAPPISEVSDRPDTNSQQQQAIGTPIALMAEVMRYPQEQIYDQLAASQTPVLLNQRQVWGLSPKLAEQFHTWNYHQERIMLGFEKPPGEDSTSTGGTKKGATKGSIPVVSATETGESIDGSSATTTNNGTSTTTTRSPARDFLAIEKNWKMPAGFTPRLNSRTSAVEALKRALESLPKGTQRFGDRLNCLGKLDEYPMAQKFLDEVASHFKVKPNFEQAISLLKSDVTTKTE